MAEYLLDHGELLGESSELVDRFRQIQEVNKSKRKLNFRDIPLDDKKTWKLIQSGFTKGVFQLEKQLGKRYSKEIKPSNIDELSDVISLIRPGCLSAEFREKPDAPGEYSSITNTYIKVKNGEWEPEYLHPALEPILGDTYSVLIYQEQIMKIASDIAGFTLQDADVLRKCVHGDSYLHTKDGYFKIRDLVGQRKDVLTCANYSNKYNLAEKCFKQREKKACVKVTLDGQTEIVCTPDHRFFTNYGWVEAQNLTTSHYCVHDLSPKYGTEQIDDREIYLTIALVTEGYLPDKKNANTFTNKDYRELEKFKLYIRELFGLELKEYVDSKGVTKLVVPDLVIEKLGLTKGGTFAYKELPEKFLRLPKEKLLLAVAKLIDFDGWVSKEGAYYTSKSLKLAKQVQMLFECLGGIRAYICTKKNPDYGKFYEVCVKDIRCLDSLEQLIPYSYKINKNTFSKTRKRNGTNLVVPNNIFRPIVENLIENSGFSKNELLSIHMSGSYFKRPLSIDRLEKILSLCGRNKQLEFFINKNAYWNRVVSVEDAGMHEVYDFTMSSHITPQAYVNNILIHNSVGKKKEDLIKTLKTKFVDGCVEKSGLDRETAEEIFGWIEKFSGYGFNKSHGISYAMMGYQTAYAKAHYPMEFFSSKLAHAEGKQDTFAEIEELVNEAKLFKVDVKPPKLGKLNTEFAVTGPNEISFGLAHIKGVGKSAIGSIKKLSNSLDELDFYKRCFGADSKKSKKVRSNVVEALIRSGACDEIGDRIHLLATYRVLNKAVTERERKVLFEYLEKSMSLSDAVKKLVDNSGVPNKNRKPKIRRLYSEINQKLAGNTKRMKIALEKHLLGIPLSGSLVELYQNERVNVKCRDFHRLRDKTHCSLGVVIDHIKLHKDKNHNQMAFLRVSDETYMLDSVVVFASTYNKVAWILEEGLPVLIVGRKSQESFLVKDIKHL